MHKFGTIFTISAIVGIALMNFSSCEKYILPEINLSADTLAISDETQILSVDVKSNVKWQAAVPVDDSSWLSVSPKVQVKGDTTITITVKANESETSREGSVTVTSETLKKFIVVSQDGLR